MKSGFQVYEILNYDETSFAGNVMEKITSIPSPSQLVLRLLKQLMEKFPFLHPKYRHIIHEYRFTWVKWHSTASHFYEARGILTQDEWLGVAQPVRGQLFLITVLEYFANTVRNSGMKSL